MRARLTHLTFLVAIFGLLVAPVPADSVLNFTRASFARDQFLGFAIANPADTAAPVTLTAYRSDGSPFTAPGVTNPRTLQIGSRQQEAFLLNELFPAPAEPDGTPASLWVQCTSPVNGLAGFFLFGDSAVQTLDGSDPSGSDTELFLMLADDTAASPTEVHIVNPGTETASVSVEFRRSDGVAAGTASFTLAPKAALHQRLGDLFPNRPAQTASIRLLSSSPIVAEQFSREAGRPSFIALNAQRAAAVSRFLNFPQLASGGEWASQVGILNISGKTIIATFRAYEASGALFVPPTVSQNTVQRAIPQGGLLRLTAEELFGFRTDQTTIGWLQVEGSDAGLTGYVAYGTGATRAMVAAQHKPLTTAIFSHQAEGAGFYTGLAILNPSAFTANVQVYSLNADGSLRGKSKKALKPNQRESLLLRQWIPAADGVTKGYILLRADVPVIATELFGTTSQSALANVPPQAVLNDFDPAPEPNLRINPPLAVVEARSSQQFRAQGLTGVTWSVEGAAGSSGTVNSGTGLFTAPSVLPPSRSVTLIATAAGGAQVAGATIDLVEKKTLTSGLAVVRAVSYMEGSRRLFLAEQQTLGGKNAGGIPTRIAEVKSAGTETLLNVDDTIEKMLPFTARNGREYLLLAGFDNGVIYRLDPSVDQQPVRVIEGLAQPSSMAFTETGDLAIAEQGANQIRIFPRARFDIAKSGGSSDSAEAAADSGGAGERRIDFNPPSSVTSPRGLAVDSCTGEIFYTDGNGHVFGVLGGRSRLLAGGLENPGEILAIRRTGTRCPSGLVLFVVEAPAGRSRVHMIIPDRGEDLILTANLNLATDLIFLPQRNAFDPEGNQASILIADAAFQVARGSIQQIEVGNLYTTQNEPIIPPANQQRVTVTIDGTGTLTLGAGAQATSYSTFLNLTFTGLTYADGVLSAARDARVSGTAGGALGAGGINFGNTSLTLTNASAAAGSLQESGISGAFLGTAGSFDTSANSVAIFLSGNDLQTVDYVFVAAGTSTPSNFGFAFYVRKGSLFFGDPNDPSNADITSTANFRVTIR